MIKRARICHWRKNSNLSRVRDLIPARQPILSGWVGAMLVAAGAIPDTHGILIFILLLKQKELLKMLLTLARIPL